MGDLVIVRAHLRTLLKHIGIRMVVRLMRWADPSMVHSESPANEPTSPSSDPSATTNVAPLVDDDDEAEIEAALAEAMARSHAMADAPPREEIYVYAEPTPNPNAMKFTVSVPILTKGSISLSSADQAANHPLGIRLFAIPGVEGLFAVNDFCTVTKSDTVSWSAISDLIETAIIDVLGQ